MANLFWIGLAGFLLTPVAIGLYAIVSSFEFEIHSRDQKRTDNLVGAGAVASR